MKILTFSLTRFHENREILAAPVASENPILPGRQKLSAKSALAAVGLAGGFLLLLSGLAMWAISFLFEVEFRNWDAILMISAFVFLGFGAHFLDKAAAEEKAENLSAVETSAALR